MAISVSSVDAVAARIRGARNVAFGAYVLAPGKIERALIDAAEHGAHVEVTLQRDPYRGGPGERHENRDAARLLRAAGAHVTLLARERTPFHLKAAICDGAAYLDDRNWTGDDREIIVATRDKRDVDAVQSALGGTGAAGRALATRKDAALRREAQLIDASPDRDVIVETESFGAGAVSAALRRHALHGARTTLIVAKSEASHNRAERALLRSLQRDGVTVCETSVNEKLALAGATAWVGSANATYALGAAGAQIDWGIVTRSPAVVAAVRASLERDLSGTPHRYTRPLGVR